MGLQFIIGAGALVILLLITFLLYNKRKFTKREILKEQRITVPMLVDIVKIRIVELLKDDAIVGKDGEEWERAYTLQRAINEATKGCVYGILKHKIVVKDLIKNIIKEILETDERVDSVIDFNSPFLDPMIKFEILCYFLIKEPDIRYDVIRYLFNKYGTDNVKFAEEDGERRAHYAWTTEELNYMYENEINFQIEYIDKLEILSTIIYQKFKGFGVIDTLRDLTIDGLNFGTSGSVLAETFNSDRNVSKAAQSVWIYYKGKYVHAEFFNFYSETEVRRVVQLLCRYGNPGPLTEKRGYIVNNMYDQSRVLAIRPPVSEYWAVFVRKFDLGEGMTLKKLCNPPKRGEGGEILYDENGDTIPLYKNWKIVFDTTKSLMRGQVTCAVTGRQGSGKTTFMKYMIEYIDARFTLRILEMTFEMFLREIYPERRNILAVQETATVSAAELQDALKKSDAAVSIVGEVATDIIAARMLQMGQVSAIFTIFSHHATTTPNLVEAITNSVVAASGGTATPATVKPQVIEVIKVDIHLNYDTLGNRYIERITEIIPYSDKLEYIELDKGRIQDPNWRKRNKEYIQAVKAYNDSIYQRKSTDIKSFVTRDIIVFDTENFEYKAVGWFSAELTKHIRDRTPREYREEFLDLYEKYFKEVA